MALARDGSAFVTQRVVEAGGAALAVITPSPGPVIAVTLHAGHGLRPDLEQHLALEAADRLREEDPATELMVPAGVGMIEVLRSRFEVDLNRPRFRAVYQGPQDSWGLDVYRHELPDEVDRVSRSVYDTFYAAAFDTLSRVAEQHERFVVLDLHSYNHRRDGARGPAAPVAQNPEINVGTGRIDREQWAPVVDAFLATANGAGYDCRENVKFRGGHFAHWVSETFPDQGATLAIEFKKTYMDEWTGAIDDTAIARIRAMLRAAIPAIETALSSVR